MTSYEARLKGQLKNLDRPRTLEELMKAANEAFADMPAPRRAPRVRKCIAWQSRPCATRSALVLKQVDAFDARGKLLVYRRADKFPGLPTLWLDLWMAKDGTVYSRFHSRGIYVDQLDFEVVGLDLRRAGLPDPRSNNECFVPRAVRERYDDWVIERIDYPDA